jgi:AraC family transcriptional regulator
LAKISVCVVESTKLMKPSLPSRRVLRKFETPVLKVEEIAYAAGVCIARHADALPFFACTLAGLHWSGHSYGGHTCVPGSVRFLPAGESHENYFPRASRCLLVKLQRDILRRACEHSAIPSMPGQLAARGAAKLCTLLRTELRHNDDLSSLAVEELTLELLLTEAKDSWSSATPIPGWLRRIQEMLHEESDARLTLAELARSAGRHPVQVCRQFHRRFSCTIGEYVRRIRVGRAQTLLRISQMPVAQIALTCGFSDQSQFTTAFRRLTGLPPHRYRKQFDENSRFA